MLTTCLDSSSAILLTKAGLHERLADTYHIVVSHSVFDEITIENRPGSSEWQELQRARKLILKGPLPEKESKGLEKMGCGERDILLLYMEGCGDFVMTDDGRAARYCLEKQIPFINALLFPLVLLYLGRITARNQADLFQQLSNLGRYSKKVLRTAENCTREDIRFCLQATFNNCFFAQPLCHKK